MLSSTPPRYPMFSPCSTFIWFYCAINFVPGGAMIVALKTNSPKFCAYANNLGFFCEVHKRFMVISACFTIQHHK